MRKKLFVLFLVLCYNATHYQAWGSPTTPIDSIKNLIPLQTGKTKLKSLIQLSYLYSYTNIDSAKKYSDRANLILSENFDSTLVTQFLIDRAYIEKRLGNYEDAVRDLLRAVQIAEIQNNYPKLYQSTGELGSLFTELAIYDKALGYLFRTIQLKEEHGTNLSLASTYNNLGLLYYRMSDLKNAEKYYLESINIRLSYTDSSKTYSGFLNLGLVYNEMEDDAKAIQSLEIALKLDENFNNMNARGHILNGLGQVYVRNNNYKLASQYLLESVKESTKSKNSYLSSTNYYFLAKLEYANNNLDKALEYLNISHEFATRLNNNLRIKNNFRLYAMIFEKKANYDSAYFYQVKFTNLSNEIFNKDLADNISNLQISLIEEESKKVIEAQEQTILQRTLISLSLITIIILMVTLVVSITKAHKKVKAINLQLKESNDLIDSQKAVLEKQNVILEDAKETITQKNEALKNINNNLEVLVEERTNELSVANLGLKKAMLNLDSFLYKTSHELKGPIASLLGLVNLAKLEKDNNKQEEYFELITSVLNNQNKMLTHLIKIHEVFQLKVNMKDVAIEGLFRDLTLENTNKKLDVYFKSDVDVPIKTDIKLIRMLIENMIENAEQFATKSSSNANIYAGLEDKDLVLIFRDNGFGILETEEQHIFDIFHKASPKSNTSGLSLFTAKTIVEKLKGSIRLVKLSGDTTYEVRIPS